MALLATYGSKLGGGEKNEYQGHLEDEDGRKSGRSGNKEGMKRDCERKQAASFPRIYDMGI